MCPLAIIGAADAASGEPVVVDRRCEVLRKELDLGTLDVQAMTEQLRQGLTARTPAVILDGEIEIDEVYVAAGHKDSPAAVAKRGARGEAGG